ARGPPPLKVKLEVPLPFSKIPVPPVSLIAPENVTAPLVRFWTSIDRPELLLIVAPTLTLPVPWLMSTSAPVPLANVLLVTVTAPLTLVRLRAFVPPVVLTWLIVTGWVRATPAVRAVEAPEKLTELTRSLLARVTVPMSVGAGPLAIAREFSVKTAP